MLTKIDFTSLEDKSSSNAFLTASAVAPPPTSSCVVSVLFSFAYFRPLDLSIIQLGRKNRDGEEGFKGRVKRQGRNEKAERGHTKLAGDPPCKFKTSMVAIANPAPLTKHPTFPSSLIKFSPYCSVSCCSYEWEETYLGGLDLLRILLGGIPEFENVFLSEICVVVETEFSVHTGISAMVHSIGPVDDET
jgi:hypothetical protein